MLLPPFLYFTDGGTDPEFEKFDQDHNKSFD